MQKRMSLVLGNLYISFSVYFSYFDNSICYVYFILISEVKKSNSLRSLQKDCGTEYRIGVKGFTCINLQTLILMISILPSMYLAVKERIIKGVQFQTNN